MTNKTMLSVEREMLENHLSLLSRAGLMFTGVVGLLDSIDELRALLDKPVFESQYDGMTQAQAQSVSDGVDEILHGKPAAQHNGEPVAWSYCPECGCEEIHHECGDHKQCKNCHQEWFSDIDYSEVVRGNLQKLKAEQPAPVATRYRFDSVKGSMVGDERGDWAYVGDSAPVAGGTTSDKYKAELYDEVWQKARDMGFANVTDALEKLGSPVAVVIDEDQSFAMWMHEAVEFTHGGGKVSKIQRREIVELSEERWALDAWKGRAKLAGKSAPVAVVMPERKPMHGSHAQGYNEALDEVARLNGVNP